MRVARFFNTIKRGRPIANRRQKLVANALAFVSLAFMRRGSALVC